MKIFLHLVLLIHSLTMISSRSLLSKESSYEMITAQLANKTSQTNIFNELYQVSLSPNPQLIKYLRLKLREVGHWMLQKQNEGTFIGRCFGVARQIRFAMPIIMVKLGVIVTILAFLTIFSIKTIGLLLVMLMFGASSAFTKLALWKTEGAYYHQPKPQNVHFHIHKGKHGEFNISPIGSPWDRTSSENVNNNFAETDAEFREKLNYLAKYQKGLYDT